ncbi:MAG: hypothetical protein SFY66_06000 [Oculatellaceae cyanobacterium bins.114]|nr:hypothetical protein [Oculatellaceae cyanobacterium bins.114]
MALPCEFESRHPHIFYQVTPVTSCQSWSRAIALLANYADLHEANLTA